VVGGGARRQRRDDLIGVQSQAEDWLLDVARSEIMAWMEGLGGCAYIFHMLSTEYRQLPRRRRIT
jgi:hypothetical protein